MNYKLIIIVVGLVVCSSMSARANLDCRAALCVDADRSKCLAQGSKFHPKDIKNGVCCDYCEPNCAAVTCLRITEAECMKENGKYLVANPKAGQCCNTCILPCDSVRCNQNIKCPRGQTLMPANPSAKKCCPYCK
ncbi:hypothetical protein PPL_10934 [Heterostelium album PN500]|uniref:Uncharacterized protein n=1 Tax=Heterostelium pallidum (strain ATCC 26659 / Pp 5 / PN500) TaxID=670386 RepID=D3BSG6_HETP5|nr:hypothetical protein PPL_10934 [Heterostelium album PN500]EFA75672.1 hypothetical protein PPL_10934 [Heterostelium album PN500]|eukprot:XP_020427806.1 hypothetical protein PPL_10934 [Heterostelium album PN500]